jgi:hypothetical protein
MACKSWYPCGTLRWRENSGQAGVVRLVGCRGGGLFLRGLAAAWQGAGGCPPTPVFLSGTRARMQVWRWGLDLRVAHCCFEHAGQILVPTGPPGIRARVLMGEARSGVLAMMAPQEIDDEEYEQVLERVAAVDVAKGTGMVCTRVPHPSRPGKRRPGCGR